MKKIKKVLVFFLPLVFYFVFFLIFFSPVLRRGEVLAPGDGAIFNYPVYVKDFSLWVNGIFSGYPGFADPQFATWYPLRLIFSLLRIDFSMYVVSAYILGSFFTYKLIKAYIHSNLIAIISGIIFGISGFLIAHLGHPSMIQASIWLPLLIYAITKIAQTDQNRKNLWVYSLLVVIATSFGILAGHPQISVYIMALSVIYIIFCWFYYPINRKVIIKYIVPFIILGCSLASIQILPTLEMYKLTPRESLSFTEFNSYANEVYTLPLLLFPYFFGYYSTAQSIYKYNYFGPWNLTEITGYVGIFVLVLALIGFYFNRKNKLVIFWAFVTLVSLIFSLGDSAPFSKITYLIPIINLFRGLGRLLLLFSLSISVLASFGVKFIFENIIKTNYRESIIKISKIAIGFVSLVLIMIAIFRVEIINKAFLNNAIVTSSIISPLKNNSLLIPIVILLVGLFVLYFAYKIKNRNLLLILIGLIIIVDLASFGWFYEWRYYSPKISDYTISAGLKDLVENPTSKGYRFITTDGVFNRLLQTNSNLIQNVEIVNGYSPLILQNYKNFTTINNAGIVENKKLLFSDNYILDLLSVKYVVLNDEDIKQTENFSRFKFVKDIRVQEQTYHIYENTSVFQRARLVNSIDSQNEDSILSDLQKSKQLSNNYKQTAYINNSNVKTTFGNSTLPNVIYNRISADEIELTFDSSLKDNSYLVLSEWYYPGWQALEDGNSVSIDKVDYGFIGINVNKGTNKVILKYAPTSLRTGIIITLISILITACYIFLLEYKKRKNVTK